MSEEQKSGDKFVVEPTPGTVLFADGKLLPIGRQHRRMIVEWPEWVSEAEVDRMFAEIRAMIKPRP